jgi:putative ABC transport system permease protein
MTGGINPMQHPTRDHRGLPFVETLLQDLRIALRMLRHSPTFAAVAICSLALGIGGSMAAFSLFNAVMLRPLSVPHADDLVLIQPLRRGDRFVLFNPLFDALRDRQHTLTGLAAIADQPYLPVTFDDARLPAYVRGTLVSGDYFRVLGVAPALGRLLGPKDDALPRGSGPCSAVISDTLWRRRYEHRADVVGRTLRVRELVCNIVGVAPASFHGHGGGYRPDVWLPLRPLTDRSALGSRRMAFFSGILGRLAPGVTIKQAQTELTSLYRRAIAEQPASVSTNHAPDPPADFAIHLMAGAQGLDTLQDTFGLPLTIAIIVVGIVLLIAAVNIANLLLARGMARVSELATRAALGASRARLLRQLATEGTVTVVLGGVLGGALASWAAPPLGSWLSARDPTLALDTHIDQHVILAGILATTLAALVSGILPAFRLSRVPLSAGMAADGRTTAGSGQRLMRILVGAQLALSLLLAMTAALLLQTIVHLTRVHPGFQPDHVVVLEIRDEALAGKPGTPDTAEQQAQRAVIDATLDTRLNAIPGVRAASVSWLGLFSANDRSLNVINADQPNNRGEVRVDFVSPRYFETVGMQLARGRGLSDRDREGTERVAVVNEAMARLRFNGEALGHRLTLDHAGERDRPFTVVGIVRDAKYNSLRETRTRPMMWAALAQAPYRISSVALRTEPGAEAAVLREAEAVLKVTNGDLMVRTTTTLTAEVDKTTARERLLTRLASGFAAIAVLLAAIGLYGTLTYAVRRRTREIGVRMACGATRSAVLSLVLRDALTLAVVSIIVGAPLAIGLGFVLRPILFGVTPLDPVTIIACGALMAIVALLAAYLPARRAASVDPVIALRWE